MLPRKGQCEVPSIEKFQHDFLSERIISEVAKVGNSEADVYRNRRTMSNSKICPPFIKETSCYSLLKL